MNSISDAFVSRASVRRRRAARLATSRADSKLLSANAMIQFIAGIYILLAPSLHVAVRPRVK